MIPIFIFGLVFISEYLVKCHIKCTHILKSIRCVNLPKKSMNWIDQ